MRFRSVIRAAVGLAVAAGSLARPVPAQAAIMRQTVATGLEFPAAFTVVGGQIIYGERLTGEIRMINLSTGANRLFFTIQRVATTGEQGLLGIEVHPNYPTTPYVYAFVTRTTASGLVNQVVRITNSGGTGTGLTVLARAPVGTIHNGGRILFGPDGMLYAVVGENGIKANAQDLSTNAGKVLRMTANGAVPADNPLAGSLVFAYGVRNSFGMAFDPSGGRLWKSDNGPECNDEVNVVESGSNLGWGPKATCSTPPAAPANTNQDGTSPRLPAKYYPTPIAPTGVAFCSACGLNSEGRLFVAGYKTGVIRRLTLDAARTGVVADELSYDHPSGVLALEVAPKGRIYFSDSTGIHRLVQSA